MDSNKNLLFATIYLHTKAFLFFIMMWFSNLFESNIVEIKCEPEKIIIVPPKYEDKYLNDIRNMKNEWEFTENDQNEITKISDEYIAQVQNEDKNVYFDLLSQYSKESDAEKKKELHDAIADYHANNNDLNELKSTALEFAKNEMINRKKNSLKNSFVMEKTPQGNVIMLYDNDKGCFKYYSDSSTPYRYLETVARKYVKMFRCRPLYIDMEEELKLVEKKWTKEYELKRLAELEKKKQQTEKKSVFAKFKSYNKSTGHVSMAGPPKNSLNLRTNNDSTKEDEKILLKENANRYIYEGKIANFQILQKVEKKVFNKKLGLSFSEFKKLQNK
jgi:hypothetical protein